MHRAASVGELGRKRKLFSLSGRRRGVVFGVARAITGLVAKVMRHFREASMLHLRPGHRSSSSVMRALSAWYW